MPMKTMFALNIYNTEPNERKNKAIIFNPLENNPK
jgi:hypothetical protein